jgi:hypothetical protein
MDDTGCPAKPKIGQSITDKLSIPALLNPLNKLYERCGDTTG